MTDTKVWPSSGLPKSLELSEFNEAVQVGGTKTQHSKFDKVITSSKLQESVDGKPGNEVSTKKWQTDAGRLHVPSAMRWPPFFSSSVMIWGTWCVMRRFSTGSVGGGVLSSGKYSLGVLSSIEIEIPSKRALRLVVLSAVDGACFDESM